MKRLSLVLGLVACVGFCGPAGATLLEVNFRSLDDPFFAGRSPGLDLLWGTADDFADPIVNPFGYSVSGREVSTLSGGVYANGVPGATTFATSTATYQFDTATNNFDIVQYRSELVFSCEAFFCGSEVVNSPDGPYTLISPPLNASNAGTYDPISQTGTFDFNLSQPFLGPFFLEAETHLIFNGQDPFAFAAEFGNDIAAHMDYLIRSGTLPTDWFGLTVTLFNGQSYPDPFINYFYIGNEYFTLADVSVVPEPTTLALMALGVAGLGYSRRKGASV